MYLRRYRRYGLTGGSLFLEVGFKSQSLSLPALPLSFPVPHTVASFSQCEETKSVSTSEVTEKNHPPLSCPLGARSCYGEEGPH